MSRFWLLVLAPALSAQAPPAPPLVTDRPDQTESARVVPLGALQVEAGALLERATDAAGRRDGATVGALLRYGVHRRFELRLGLDVLRHETLAGGGPSTATTDGVDAFDLGFKVGLAAPDAAFELAVLGGAGVSAGALGVPDERVEPHGRVALAVPLTGTLGFGLNAGAFREGGRTDGLYTAVLGITLAERVAAFVESYGTVPVSAGGEAAHAMDGGFTLLLGPTLQLDASGGLGLNAAAPDWFVGFGMAVRVGR